MFRNNYHKLNDNTVDLELTDIIIEESKLDDIIEESKLNGDIIEESKLTEIMSIEEIYNITTNNKKPKYIFIFNSKTKLLTKHTDIMFKIAEYIDFELASRSTYWYYEGNTNIELVCISVESNEEIYTEIFDLLETLSNVKTVRIAAITTEVDDNKFKQYIQSLISIDHINNIEIYSENQSVYSDFITFEGCKWVKSFNSNISNKLNYYKN
jgi:hypothetical protein